MKKIKLSKIFIRNYIFILFLFLLSFILTVALFYVFNDSSRYTDMYSADLLMNDDYNSIDSDEIVEIGGGMCVIDSNYTVLRSEGEPLFSHSPISVSEFTDFLVSTNDSSYHASVKYNDYGDFWLIVVLPRQVRFEMLLYLDNSSGYTTILFFLSALAISSGLFIVSIFIYSFITSATLKKPLTQLKNAADNIKTGCYDLPAPDSRISELYNVQEAFYLMSDKISREIRHTKHSEENRKKLMLDISHDLKNPLMSMKGYSELLLQSHKNIEAKKIEQYLLIISENCLRADKLVQDLFLLAKMEHAEDILQFGQLDIAELLKASLIERFDEFESSGLRTNFDIPDEEIMISGDADKLNRTFSNILDNALTYRNDNTVFHIKLIRESDHTVITFTNGSTLKIDDNTNLTEPFVRANKSESLSPEGTGLGLSIVNQIIKLHGGTVSCGYINGFFKIGITLPLFVPKI